jgi:hypothetical protein
VPSYRIVFPDFRPKDMPRMPVGFEDQSWKNDACPSFRHDGLSLTIYVDYADEDVREVPEAPRFSLYAGEYADWDAEFHSDDWDAILAAVALRAALTGGSTP